MKKIALCESNGVCTVTVEEEILAREPGILEQDGRPVAVILPMAKYEAFQAWQEILGEPWPQEPPPTPEGDQEALAAVARLRTLFPPLDAEITRYIAESEELALDYKFLLDDED